MYDLTKAEEIKHEDTLIGYLFQLNDEMWLPLSLSGELLGPPSYKQDAHSTILRANGNIL